MNKFLSTTTSTQQLALLSIGQPRFLSSNSKSFIRARRPLSSSIEKNNNNKSKGGGGSYYISHVHSNWNNLHSTSSRNTNGCRCGRGSGSGCTRDCINRSLHTSCVRFFYSSSPIQHNQQNSNNDNGNKCGHDNGSTSNNSNNSNNNTDDILNKTTPLSDVSPSDLQLAMEATGTTGTTTATDMENHHHHQQQQEQLLNSLNLDNIPGTSKGGSRKLAIIYTCNVCNTRSAKKFTERAYNHGVVLVRCPSCESLHLIADRLGFFTDDDDNDKNNDNAGGNKKGWDIEMFMERIGKQDNIKVVTDGESDDVLEVVTAEDIVGKTMMDRINTEKESNSSNANKSNQEKDNDSAKKHDK